MSSDLFAAFGGDSTPNLYNAEYTLPLPNDSFRQTWSWGEAPEHAKTHTNEVLRRQAESTTVSKSIIEDNDDFGDFEDASVFQAPPANEETISQQSVFKGRSASVPLPTNDLPFKPRPASTPTPVAKEVEDVQSKIGQHPFAGKWDLLFEAGDDEYDAGADELGDLSTNPEAAMAYSKRLIAEQEAAQGKKSLRTHKPPISGSSAAPAGKMKSEVVEQGPNKLRKKSGYAPPTRHAEVLFDADNVSEHEEDDEFGDFEDWSDVKPASMATAARDQPKMLEIDLLGLEDPSEPSQQSKSGFPNAQNTQSTNHDRPKASTQMNDSVPRMDQDDDAWDDFETSDTIPQPSLAARSPLGTSVRERTAGDPPKTSQPPTNVPPPLILLSIFSRLFASADDALFDTMGKLEFKQRQALLAHPASHQFLRGYLGHCNVLAHIISGRKLRWKRDQRLAESMRIGPAASGGKGGMKLAGLDKSELAKEDREVLDVLRLWKGQVGKLRTAVTAASAAPGLPKLPPVPDLAEQMPVKILKQVEGGFPAPHPCAICGLKREERVAKVDVEVEDSFGEWWVQNANVHVSCGKFWEEFEKKLKSR